MILECKNVSFSYSKENVLNDVSLSVEKGDFVVLLGPNGNGKTTLIKCINQLNKKYTGEIYLDDKNIKEYKTNELSQKIGYVPQYLEFGNMTVFDAVLMGRIPYIKWNASNEDLEIVNELLEKLDLTKIALKNVNELSGGERQKVAIARALALQPEVLLFDEPTSNLDIKNQYETMNLIKKVGKENNLTILITMHDINLALRYGEKFLLLKNGKMISQGKVEIVNEKNLKEVFDIETNILNINENYIVIPKGGNENE